MTRLPTLTARRVIRALQRGGFEVVRQRGSHLILQHVTRNAATCVPNHSKDIKRSLLRNILRQARLTEAEFHALI